MISYCFFFFFFGDIICTHREIHCLQYAGYLYLLGWVGKDYKLWKRDKRSSHRKALFWLFTVECRVFTALYILYTVRCIAYALRWMLFSLECIVYPVQSSLYSVHSRVELGITGIRNTLAVFAQPWQTAKITLHFSVHFLYTVYYRVVLSSLLCTECKLVYKSDVLSTLLWTVEAELVYYVVHFTVNHLQKCNVLLFLFSIGPMFCYSVGIYFFGTIYYSVKLPSWFKTQKGVISWVPWFN